MTVAGIAIGRVIVSINLLHMQSYLCPIRHAAVFTPRSHALAAR